MTSPATTPEENQSVTTRDLTQAQPENYPENPDQSNVPTNLSIQEVRQQLVSLYVRGDSNDARALFSAAPSATEEGWTNFERILTPVKDFVIMGNLPYAQVGWTGEYSGVGDTKNEDRDAIEAGREVTLESPSGQTAQAVQQEQASGEIETTPLPGAQPTQSAAQTDGQTQTETEQNLTASGLVSAGDLVERARTANTAEELDEIEGLAEGRTTVLNAVENRRTELNLN